MGKTGTSHVERDRCPLYTAIGVIQGRWKPMIFRRLSEGPLGFGALRKTMPGVTIKVLRQQLRELEADGLVVRSVREKPALQVKYHITPHGETLGPVFETLWTWGTLHLAKVPHEPDEAIMPRSTGIADPVSEPQNSAEGPSLFTAVKEQLGLKLEPTKGRSEFLVVDHVDKPSAN